MFKWWATWELGRILIAFWLSNNSFWPNKVSANMTQSRSTNWYLWTVTTLLILISFLLWNLRNLTTCFIKFWLEWAWIKIWLIRSGLKSIETTSFTSWGFRKESFLPSIQPPTNLKTNLLRIMNLYRSRELKVHWSEDFIISQLLKIIWKREIDSRFNTILKICRKVLWQISN